MVDYAFPSTEDQSPGMTMREYYMAHCPITITEANQLYVQARGVDDGYFDRKEVIKFWSRLREDYAKEMMKR